MHITIAGMRITRTCKRCARCGETKERDGFSRCARAADGLQAYCKACRKEIAVAHYAGAGGEKKRARSVALHREQREAVIAHYGGRCACCGESEYQFLAIDHERGDGADHRRSDTGALSIIWWLRRNGMPSGFRVLCHNCNMARGFYGYCPHEAAV